MKRNRKLRADEKTCRREQEVRMKVGRSDGQLEEKHEQREKKQKQSEVERWNSGNQLRNRLGKERVSHTHIGLWNMSSLQLTCRKTKKRFISMCV